MRIFLRGVHAVSVLLALFLGGAVVFFALSSVGLHARSYEPVIEWGLMALPWILLALAVWSICKKVSYRVIIPIIGLCGGFVLYVVWDDRERPPPPDIGPIVPADSKSYEAYRWFLKGDPHSRLAEFPADSAELPAFPTDHAKWPEFFAKNRDVFIQAWDKDTLGRAWIGAMSQYEPDGIYSPLEKHDGPILVFRPIRINAQAHWGYAQVLMLENRYDEAARLLVSHLRASYHLQRGGSLLITEMISTVMIRGTLEQFEILAESGKLSSSTKSEVGAVLREAPPIQMVFRNAFNGEQVIFRALIETVRKNQGAQMESESAREDKKNFYDRFLTRLLFNPHRVEREYADFIRDLTRLSEQHQLDAASKLVQNYFLRMEQTHIKNPLGQMLKLIAVPAFHKTTSELWKIEDRRLALLKRLETP